jgi:hypothetical protein
MSRKLNIERRRKRIRHYHARRRQRSLFRRLFSYWWSTVILLLFVATAVVNVFTWVQSQKYCPSQAFLLPPERESLHYISNEELKAFLSRGTLQHTSRLISDADVGISLDLDIPEIIPFEVQSLGAFPTPPLESPSLAAAHLIPDAYDDHFAPTPLTSEFNTLCSPSLIDAQYTFTLPEMPENDAGEAIFVVQTATDGKVETILRLSPSGQETPFLRQLRLALLNGSAKRDANGTIRLQWRNKEAIQ